MERPLTENEIYAHREAEEYVQGFPLYKQEAEARRRFHRICEELEQGSRIRETANHNRKGEP